MSRSWARVACAALMLGGCARGGVVVAADGEHRLIARDQKTGITVILTTGAWDGEPRNITRDLTVVHALVANMGKQPVLLAPGDLELRDLSGFRYDLLDAGATFFAASAEQVAKGRYSVQHDSGYDPGRGNDYGLIRTPHGDVSRAALPWGVLEPGTQMRGFLYFERVERTANEATLVWHLGGPDHRAIVDLQFQFYVARPRA